MRGAVRVPGGFPAGLPLWPGGHRVGLPTLARLEFIRVYALNWLEEKDAGGNSRRELRRA